MRNDIPNDIKFKSSMSLIATKIRSKYYDIAQLEFENKIGTDEYKKELKKLVELNKGEKELVLVQDDDVLFKSFKDLDNYLYNDSYNDFNFHLSIYTRLKMRSLRLLIDKNYIGDRNYLINRVYFYNNLLTKFYFNFIVILQREIDKDLKFKNKLLMEKYNLISYIPTLWPLMVKNNFKPTEFDTTEFSIPNDVVDIKVKETFLNLCIYKSINRLIDLTDDNIDSDYFYTQKVFDLCAIKSAFATFDSSIIEEINYHFHDEHEYAINKNSKKLVVDCFKDFKKGII